MRARETFLLATLAVTVVAGCGGEDPRAASPTTEVAAESPAGDGEPVTTAQADEFEDDDGALVTSAPAVGGPTRWEFHLVDREGWEYDVWIESTLDIVSAVDISDSPPGKARIAETLTGTASFAATGTLPGRTAPELRAVTITHIRTLTGGPVTLDTHNTVRGPLSPYQPCYDDHLSRYVDDHSSSTWDAWVCPILVTTSGASFLDNGSYSSVTPRISEADAEAIVASLNDPAESYLLATIGASYGACPVQLFTDGTLGQVGESRCTIESDALRTEDTTPVQDAAAEAACPPADGSARQTYTFEAAPPMCIDPAKTYTAEIVTSEGALTVELFADRAPLTVNNFVTLARYHFFDGIPCHRIIPGFMAQCGDRSGTGSGGPGYTFADELPTDPDPYKAGVLAMANSGPNTNGSQFFVMLADSPLAPNNSVFGQVTSGFGDTIPALDAAGNPDPGANGVPPLKPVTILSVQITET